MKKFLSLVLALVMTMSLVTISAGAKDFTDDSKITYEEAVDVMSAIKVVGGYPDGSFNPQGGLTRGAAAKIICNLILGPTTADALNADTAPYKDVAVDNTFAGYIAFCAKEGIISGYADGTFRPAAPLTGYAFMKMLLGALGYDASIEGYTGSNWSINVAKRALNIGLDDGLVDEFVGSKALTREEACLYAFNTLKAKTVTYPNSSTIVVGDITVSTSSVAEEGAKFMTKYFSKLKDSDDSDAFGRPATTWKYKGEKIGTYADEADASYTVKVSSDTIYNDLGLSKTFSASVKTDGEGDGTFTVKDNDKDTKIGGNGVLTEAFLVKDSDGDVTGVKIVKINTYVDQIDDVDTNDDDERIVEIGTMDYVTEEFAEDDWVLYTVDKSQTPDAIKSMALTEKQTGELTKKVGSKYTIDGEVYELSANAVGHGAVSVKDDVDFYLDAYGYIIKMDVASSTASVEEMAYVLNCGTSRGTGWAKLLLSNGTTKTVDTDDTYTAGQISGKLVSFEIKDDAYDLTVLAADATDRAVYNNDAAETVAFKKGKPAIDVTVGTDLSTDSKTVFVIGTADDSSDYAAGKFDYAAYTGFKTAPTVEADPAEVVAVNNKDGVAILVYIFCEDDALTSSTALTFLAGDKDMNLVDEGSSNVYYEFQAIVDGKVTTVKINSTDGATYAAADTVKVLKAVSYNSKDIGTGTNATLNTDYYQVTEVEVKNEVIVLGTSSKVWADDVKVFEVDGADIAEGLEIDDIRKDDGTKDPYAKILYTVNKDAEVDMIVLVKN